jgi:hypothetical protein
MKNLSHYSRFLGRDLKPRPPGYEFGVIIIHGTALRSEKGDKVQWHDNSTKFHECLSVGSKANRVSIHTDIMTR